jgi:hypothetical protein
MSLKAFFQNLFHRKSPHHHVPVKPEPSAPKPLDLDTATADEIQNWIIAFGMEIRRLGMEIGNWESKTGPTNPVVVHLRQRETELNTRRELARAKLAELRATK